MPAGRVMQTICNHQMVFICLRLSFLGVIVLYPILLTFFWHTVGFITLKPFVLPRHLLRRSSLLGRG